MKTNTTALTFSELNQAIQDWLTKHRPEVLGYVSKDGVLKNGPSGEVYVTINDTCCQVRVELENET